MLTGFGRGAGEQGREMGKPTGFLEVERVDRFYEKPAARTKSLREFVHPLPEPACAPRPRAAWIAAFRSATTAARSTTSSRTGTTSSIATSGRSARDAAFDQQFPGIHRPHLPGAVRGGLHAQHQRQSGDHQVDRAPSSTRAGRKAGWRRSRRRARPASGSPSSAPVRPAWPARSSSRARATTSTLFEKADRIGGLLRYGIPDFKMEKHLIDRRVEQMAAEGVVFRTSVARRRRPRRAELLAHSTRSC